MEVSIPKRAIGVALAAGASLVATPLVLPAAAAAQTFTQHELVPVTGATVTCGGTPLTASGSFAQVIHITQDDQGIIHVTGTGTPQDVTLQDPAGNVYALSGATWFGGNFTDPSGNDPIVVTSTDKFSIVSPGGGLFGSVNVTEHLSPNGHALNFDFGTCTSPA